MTIITPDKLLAPSKITFNEVKVNAYSRTFSEEVKTLGKAGVIEIYSDMLYIREFESTLKKAKEGLHGYKFNFPSHLYIGQEGVAVGQALALSKDDVIFGSHRSHGEFLAKSLRAIRLYDDEELVKIISSYPSDTYSAIKGRLSGNIKDMTLDFILYGAFSEIFARTTGLERGLGGSMHLHFTPFGCYPNNGIVGGSAPLSVGSALYDRINGYNRLTVANIGDGALNCGAVYESIAFATMNQFQGLWSAKKGLPLVFFITDNIYARGGNTKLETGSYDNPARLGAGFTSNQMSAESVNGLNPFAVRDALVRHRTNALLGKGASLINCTAYRYDEHSIGDTLNRNAKEVASWQELDPIKTFASNLIESGVLTKDELEELNKSISERVIRAYLLAINNDISPCVNLKKDKDFVKKYIFNNTFAPKSLCDEKLLGSDVYLDLINKPSEKFTLRDAISLGILEGYINFPTFVAYGEDVRGWQSKNSVFYGFDKHLPYEKLFNTPIAESAIVGAEVGYSMRGGRVIAELLYADFLTRASDEIINQSAKWQSLSGGTIKLPMTLRLPVGRSYGGQHAQDLSGIIARVNGLKVYYPATPSDMLSVMRNAISSNDPTIIFEPKEFYSVTEQFNNNFISNYKVENSSIKVKGDAITIVAVGPSLYDAISAQKESNVSCEIIALNRLAPIDYEPIVNSVKKTGKLIIMGESPFTGGIMSDICATIQKSCYNHLSAPIEILSTEGTILPPNGENSGYYDLKEQLLALLQ